jgi:kynurenine formamidase
MTFGSHTGTHIDAPSHFVQDGVTIDALPIGLCIGETTFVDLTHLSSGEEVSADDLETATSGRQLEERMVLYFGWGHKFNSRDFYSRSPYLSRDAAELLVDAGVKLLGYDAPSPDNPANDRNAEEDSPIHKLLLGSGVWLLEYMNIPRPLPSRFWMAALPLRLMGLDGSPVRCVAAI